MKAIIGAYLFSGAIALQLQLQARGTDISQYLLQAVPYLTVIVILAALSRRRANDAPESLSRVFEPAPTGHPTPPNNRERAEPKPPMPTPNGGEP